ncbi:MAG: glycosyltransferase [Solirubrobacteraceae bacterium]
MSGHAVDADGPRVTVVVPMHNGTRYLEEAIESVRDQRFGAWEAVLVDDASTDGTPALARELAARDPRGRIRVVELERNVGVAGARAAAIGAGSQAELVVLLDQDDLLCDGHLERCVTLFDERLAAGRRVAIVACDAWMLDDEGRRTSLFSERYGWTDVVDYDRMIQRNCICARALFSREAYERAGGFVTDTQPSDDYDLWLRIIELGYEVATTREVLAGYRLHAGATSRDDARMASAAIRVHRRALARRAVTARQRRALRARIRHHRALIERERLRETAARRDVLATASAAARAGAFGTIAFVQRPSRWGEWVRGLVRRAS